MNSKELASSLDIMYSDRIEEVCKSGITIYSKPYSLSEIQSQLDEWAVQGKLIILKPLAECDDMEICVKLLTWI